VPKQRCGSCRFFQDAGLAGSGWCHHPLRKTTSDLLIMVRRNELACRDEWTRTLWEEGTFGGPEPMPAQPVDPATEVEIAALVRTDLTVDDGAVTDVVLGEARLVSDATPPWRLPAAGIAAPAVPVPPTASFDSRTAILRAREAYRERVKAAERDRTAIAQAANADDAPVARAADPAVIDPLAGEFETGWAPAFEPEPEDGGGFDWALEGDGLAADLPLAQVDEHAVSADASGVGSRETGIAQEPDDRSYASLDAPLTWREAETHHGSAESDDAPAAPRRWEAIPVEPLAAQEAWTPIQPDWHAEPAGAGDADWSPVGVPAAEEDLWEPAAAMSQRTALPEPDADGGWQGTPVWDEAWIAGLARESARGEHWAEWDLSTEDDEPEPPAAEPAARFEDVETPAARPAADDLLLDPAPFAAARIDLAPNVPRICRPCRDFRPAEGGDRGWCANQWAFTHRRLVDPDEAAPCESSIGNWWLPADELYIGDADISAHGLSTPLLDRWLPGHVVAEPERKQS